MAKTNPTELFYDPMGGIKHGRNIGAIGGHGDHVHIAYFRWRDLRGFA